MKLGVLPTGEDFAEAWFERAVELDRVYVAGAVGEVPGQDAKARADLEHDVLGIELGEPPDHAQQVLVDQKVLAELLLRCRLRGPAERTSIVSTGHFRRMSGQARTS